MQSNPSDIRLDVRMRNGMRAGGIETLAIATSVPSRRQGLLWALIDKLVRRPAWTVRLFLIGPVRQSIAELEARLREQERLNREVLDTVTALQAQLATRLDELQIKVRPTIRLEDAFAVRLGDGYVLAPAEQPVFVSMLADATSGGLEPGTRNVIKKLLRPGDTAIDVGANIGLHTAACARAVGSEGAVFSFEPEARMADLLARTCAMNGFRQVTLSRKAVSAGSGSARLQVATIPGHSSLYSLPDGEFAAEETVDLVSLDEAIPAGTRVALVKIDVEGGELDVLGGMKRVLEENRDIALIAEFGPSHLARLHIDPQAWLADFEASGMVAYAIAEPTGEIRRAQIAELLEAESTNILFVRAGSSALQRISA